MDAVEESRKRHTWHLECLCTMGFNRHQRDKLLELLDSGDLDLHDLWDLIEKRRWTPEQAFLAVA